MQPLDSQIRIHLDKLLAEIGASFKADAMTIISPIYPGLENRVRQALDMVLAKKPSLAIILDTQGGIVEVVERMVTTIRNFYGEIIFIIPNRAMSAGTVFVMSGDRILMDYFSCLGPIDPQIERDGKLVPALAYLAEFDRLNDIAAKGKLTAAEFALLNKLDLGELHSFKQARELSVDLLKRWLSTYKFKNWTVTETHNLAVTKELKEKRAQQIAEQLSDTQRWHSHGRGITLRTLQDEIGLKIEDFAKEADLARRISEYFGLLLDYMSREKFGSFVHAEKYF